MIEPDFGKTISEYLTRIDSEDDHVRSIGTYFPSELSYPCLRSLFLRYKYPDKQPSPDKLRIFRIGNLLHVFLQQALGTETNQFRLCGLEQSVTYRINGIELRGRVDAIIELPDGEETVVEIKTCSPQTFNYPLPKPEHLAQTMFYLNRLHLKKAFIVYVEKNRLEIQVYPVEYDDVIFKEMIGRTRALHKALKEDVIPDQEANHWGGKICQYCDFKEECKT